MKKLLLIILALVMSFSLVACGGDNNDENNAAVQAKIEVADALVDEIISLYEDNGYAEEHQENLDKIRETMDKVKEEHQQTIDRGGYDDESAVEKEAKIDIAIEVYKGILDNLNKAVDSIEAGTDYGKLVEKHQQLVDIVNEASAKAAENGWEDSEAFDSELGATFAMLEQILSDLENPETIDPEYMNVLLTAIDEAIPVWENYLLQVSEPYVAE